ncbi:MAG: hypothetical protein Q4D91_05605 [Lautropia sp.]|nr:hypothetical protein [Lautropia sp.]
MKPVWQTLAILLSMLYPFLWYWGRDHGHFGMLAAVMGAVWAIRGLLQRDQGQRLVSALLAAFFLSAWLLQRPDAMYWYPVLVNVLMLSLFAGSLVRGPSIVERLARLQHPELPEAGVRYTRRVTQIWCLFFVINGSITLALTLMQQWDAWALYTGIIAYLLMGALLAGEWLWRRHLPALKP